MDSTTTLDWCLIECNGSCRLAPNQPTKFDLFNATRASQASSVSFAPVSLVAFPPLASRVTVAPLPGYGVTDNGDDDLGEALREHFCQPRLLHAGDIFFVPHSSADTSGAWLAVLRIDAPRMQDAFSAAVPQLVTCGVVHRGRTALLMQGVAHCSHPGAGWGGAATSFCAPVVPQALIATTSPTPTPTFTPAPPASAGSCIAWSPVTRPRAPGRPRGAAGHVAEALAALRAPLGRARGVFPAVLIHGRAGSGKRTAVASAAAYDGLSVVEVDAALLPLTTDAARRQRGGGIAAVAAEEVLAAVEEARPCVVHVRHADALLLDPQKAPSVIEPHTAQLVAALTSVKSALRAAWLAADPAGLTDDHSVVLVFSFSVNDVHAIPLAVRDAFTCVAQVRSPSPVAVLRFLQRSLERKLAVDSGARDAVCREAAGPLSGAPWRTVAAFSSYVITEAYSRSSSGPSLSPPCPLPPLTASAVAAAMARLAALNPALADAPAIPDVRYEDVGGADDAKRAIVDMVRF